MDEGRFRDCVRRPEGRPPSLATVTPTPRAQPSSSETIPCTLREFLRYFLKHANDPGLHAFVKGVTAAATGAIAGATIILAQRAIVDWSTALIALVTLGVLLRVKKVPEPLVILLAGVAGLFLFKGWR